MHLDKYPIEASPNSSVFEFVSEGRNGSISKFVQFQPIGDPDLFNLAFGDKNITTGSLDDLAISNNGDTEKVLATVVAAVIAFTDKNPDAILYATGSTPSRTRLYRIGITKFYSEVENFLKFTDK